MLITGMSTLSFSKEFLSGSRELKLDLLKPSAAIQKITNKMGAMAKTLDKSSVSVKEAMEAVQADPNPLNKAKFEKALAQHMKPVMQNIDRVLESELEMQCALEDVSVEVKRVTLRIKQDYERNSSEAEELKEVLRKEVKELKKLAAEVSAEGENVDRAKERKMKQMLRKVQRGETQLKFKNQVIKQLQAATRSLAAGGELATISENAQDMFRDIEANRASFRDLIRSRTDMANLASMGSAGSSRSLNNILKTLSETMSKMAGVGDILSTMNGSVDSIGMYNQDLSFGGGSDIDVSVTAKSILEAEFSFLN